MDRESSTAADLALASACAQGDPEALARFEAILTAIRPALAAVGASTTEIDEVLQRLRVQLLVGDQPGILAYAGRGELRAWVRVIGVREMVRLCRQGGRAEELDDERLLDSLLPTPEAERDLIKLECRAEFRGD